MAVASSLGGPPALGRVLQALPADFPASIVVAQHISERSSQPIVRYLNGVSVLPVDLASEGESVLPGRVYIARPDFHLMVGENLRFCLSQAPRVKFCRPSAEPLFTSVAASYRDRALGLVLTGCNTDGSWGAQTIKWMGGRVLAQDPASARAAGMPKAAIASGAVDYVLPLDKIADALVALVMVPGMAEYLRVVPTAA